MTLPPQSRPFLRVAFELRCCDPSLELVSEQNTKKTYFYFIYKLFYFEYNYQLLLVSKWSLRTLFFVSACRTEKKSYRNGSHIRLGTAVRGSSRSGSRDVMIVMCCFLFPMGSFSSELWQDRSKLSSDKLALTQTGSVSK